MFEIVVTIVVLSVFHLKMDQNYIFLFLKNYFENQHIKKMRKYKKNNF